MIRMTNPEDFLKILKERRTIRSFQDKMVKDKEIEMILEAGRWAPSASNRQAWEFIVVKRKEIIDQLATAAMYGKFIKDAPVIIAIVGDTHENPNWHVQDTTLASMNMMLMAWVLKIGTCWIGSLDREKAKEILSIKKDKFLLTVLPFGYIRGEIPKSSSRKALNEIIKELN